MGGGASVWDSEEVLGMDVVGGNVNVPLPLSWALTAETANRTPGSYRSEQGPGCVCSCVSEKPLRERDRAWDF